MSPLLPQLMFAAGALFGASIMGVVAYVLVCDERKVARAALPRAGSSIGCRPQVFGDYTKCHRCGQSWDTNDSHPPMCGVFKDVLP
jgi:hypothetical protein